METEQEEATTVENGRDEGWRTQKFQRWYNDFSLTHLSTPQCKHMKKCLVAEKRAT